MCGIVGIIAPGRDVAALASRMLATIEHRGPDGVAVKSFEPACLALGHARLAIIDLSPSGAQPMVLPGHDIWITFNGEIYNYKSLRVELEGAGWRFHSTSDTEVILAGYSQWGEAVLDRLDGIFGFALWDAPRERLWLVRDHLGVKPLYYCREKSSLAFASEPKALLAIASNAVTPDRQSIQDFLTFGYIPGSRTAFNGIEKLPGGHALVWERGECRVQRYWNPADLASEALDDEADAVRETRELLDSATRSQLESDVPVGLLVSGGIDSSAVASSASLARTGMEGFVIGFEDPRYDEREYARTLAAACGIRLNEQVVGTSYAQAFIEPMLAAYDEPFADSSSLPSLAVFEAVHAKGYKVVLGGDGGDELFAGYRRYDRLAEIEGHSQSAWPMKLKGSRSLGQAVHIALRPHRYRRPAWRSYYERVRIFSFSQQAQLLQADWRPTEEAQLIWPFQTYWNERLDTVKAAQVFDLQTYLPEDILTKVDRASMHFGVEARVPLLARRVVEHALRTSTDLHRLRQRRKYLLKRAMEGRVPPSLLTNRKRGFSLPLEMAIGERVRAWAAIAERSALVQDGVIAPDALRQFAGDLDKAWALYALDGWWSRWVRQDRSSPGSQ